MPEETKATAPRTERQIGKEIAAIQAEHNEAVAADTTARQDREHAKKADELRAELSASLAAGAGDCPKCGQQPHGMRKRPGLYEVGCLNCPGVRARGESAEEAAERFAGGEFVPEEPAETPAAAEVPAAAAEVPAQS